MYGRVVSPPRRNSQLFESGWVAGTWFSAVVVKRKRPRSVARLWRSERFSLVAQAPNAFFLSNNCRILAPSCSIGNGLSRQAAVGSEISSSGYPEM